MSISETLNTVIQSATFDREQIITLARQELNIFAPLLLPEVCTLPFPDYYRSLYQTILASLQANRQFDKFGLGFPRGHCKSSFAKVLTSSAIAHTKKKLILIVCSNEERAIDFLTDVMRSLDEPNFKAVYGNWREEVLEDRKQAKQFFFNGRLVTLIAAGVGTSVRGLLKNNERPDFIIGDDMQTRECAQSIAESKAFQEWFFATLLKTKSPKGCTYLYIGNMYRDIKITDTQYTCLLRNMQLNPAWKTYIVGAILANNTALWEELHPIKQLIAEYIEDTSFGHGEIYAAEVLNDPTYKPKSGIDYTKLRVRDEFPGEMHQGNFVIIDPSGRKKLGKVKGSKPSDDTAILYGKLFDGIPYAYSIESEVMTPMQTIEKAIALCLQHGCSLVGVEAVAYQETLIYWFELYCEQQNITGISIVPLTTGRQSKNERILESFKQATGREIGFTRKTLAQWGAQVQLFNPLIDTNKDDILDAVAYMPQIILKYGQLMTIAGEHTVVSNSSEAKVITNSAF